MYHIKYETNGIERDYADSYPDKRNAVDEAVRISLVLSELLPFTITVYKEIPYCTPVQVFRIVNYDEFN